MHCKDISVRSVGCELRPEGIAELMRGWKAYVRAEYLLLEHGGEYAVLRLRKADADSLFRDVTGYEIVSLPEDTVFVERPDMDVLNLPAMARLQAEFPGKAVVVRGLFSHVSFIKGLHPLRLRVVDTVPPRPSKLGYLVRSALASGYVELPVIAEERCIDMVEASKDAGTETVMFPCSGSGISADRPTCFLDEVPELKGSVTLLGCRLSKRIFGELYGREVPFINVCPKDNVPSDGVRTIVKCCRVRTGHEREGDVAAVPWGATVPEVVDAINDLFSDYVPSEDADIPMEKGWRIRGAPRRVRKSNSTGRALMAGAAGHVRRRSRDASEVPPPLGERRVSLFRFARFAKQLAQRVPRVGVLGVLLEMRPQMRYRPLHIPLGSHPAALVTAAGLLVEHAQHFPPRAAEEGLQ